MFDLNTLVVIGTDYIDSYKSNYHTITTTTTAIWWMQKLHYVMSILVSKVGIVEVVIVWYKM